MKSLRSYLLVIAALFCTSICIAQQTVDGKPEMATGMRADGKIYVVIAIVLTILFVLIAYLITVDRKLSRLEKGNK
jgi:hypothetical protein